MIQLRECQREAVKQMKNGCILCGGVGSGKSRTALAYYYIQIGGNIDGTEYEPLDDLNIKDLYIITTAKKRDDKEWEKEMEPFLLTTYDDVKLYNHKVVVDSWNNIQKYKDVTDAFFIFDEDKVTGSGAWVKAFLKITKSNDWVILSATPGDQWIDYIPVFIANGFYKNKTEFNSQHCIYRWQANGKYPVIDRYINIGRLMRLRNNILVDIKLERHREVSHEDVICDYNRDKYRSICRSRWNPWENEPIENATEFCYALRRVVNSDQSREVKLLELLEKHPRIIVFYSFDYELDILKNLGVGLPDFEIAEWNGHKHQPIPTSDKWLYLVNYAAGAEGWNCILTDTIVFWSQNYSYKTLVQACGRIDRMNSAWPKLYFYHFKSLSKIDQAIGLALKNKKKFNENRFILGKK